VTHSEKQLEEAASHVRGEWALLADSASLLSTRVRTPVETAALEATLVHSRCLIMFCCGGENGNRDKRDIQPANFLGTDWWPRDESFDRKMRDRLKFINEELQHLSWQRVLNKEPLIVSVDLLAAEVHYMLHLFVEELRDRKNRWLGAFEAQERYVYELLPKLDRPGETKPHLAPPRRIAQPPS
jgi:hypothetical protein